MASIFDLFKKIEGEKPTVKPITHILCGLGNPGKEYQATRHNAGFMLLDLFCREHNVSLTRARFHALTGEVTIGEARVLVMAPQLYMNRSGESLRDAAEFYKIPPERILVVCDDVNLDVGKLRIRRKGSDGGQKGLRDIIYQLNSDAFPRIRLGVGKLPAGGDMVSWVLGRIPEDLRPAFNEALQSASKAVPLIIEGKIEQAMCENN